MTVHKLMESSAQVLTSQKGWGPCHRRGAQDLRINTYWSQRAPDLALRSAEGIEVCVKKQSIKRYFRVWLHKVGSGVQRDSTVGCLAYSLVQSWRPQITLKL